MERHTETTALDAIIGRALRDDEFRARFIQDPLKAAMEEGYSLTEPDRVGLSRLDKAAAADFFGKLGGPSAGLMWCTDHLCYQIETQDW